MTDSYVNFETNLTFGKFFFDKSMSNYRIEFYLVRFLKLRFGGQVLKWRHM